MRKLFSVVLAAVLLPMGLAAQKVIPPVKNAPKAEPGVITLDQARTVALGQARQALARRKDPCCVPMNPGKLNVVNAALVTVGGQQAYVVAVETPGVKSSMRVTLSRKTGGVLDVKQGAWSWGVAPAWFKQGLSSPPAEKKGEDTLTVKPRGGQL